MSVIEMSLLRGSGSTGEGGELSLYGALTIPKGTSSEYTITDFDSFSTYAVRASNGFTATISGDKVTVNIPSGYANNQAVFFVSRNGVERAFTVGMSAQTLITPRIVSPANGAADQSTNITVSASNYTTIPSGIGSLAESHWQLSLTQTFTDTIRDVRVTTGNMQQTTFSELPIGTELFLRVRYRSSESSLGWSEWSAVSSFTTINESIAKPRIFLDQPPFDVNENPVFTTDAFTTEPSGRDSHLSSSWRIVKVENDGSETSVFTRLRSMEDKVRLQLPKGVLETSSEYYAQVKFEGSRIGESMWSDKLTFSTATSFVPDELGTPWEGGFYAGRIMVNGQPHAIVMASKVEGGWFEGIPWKNSNTNTPNTNSTNDSYANMQGAIAAGITNHPAFNVCYTYRGGGYDDWLLGARDVVEIMYRNFKPSTSQNDTFSGGNSSAIPPTGRYTENNPSQTPLPLFRDGASEAFQTTPTIMQWTSTQSSNTEAYNQRFSDGRDIYIIKTTTFRHTIRPVRIVPID